uniref:G domain-containing protein n=1 Tax=Pygocentrus nattereri TaxID=42514 RepID=A0AAR2KK85_PYGNA
MFFSGRGRLECELRNTKIRSSDVSHLRILLYGQIGVGKSCFVNSVDSAFQHEIINRAGEAPCSGKSYTKKYKTYKIRNVNGGFLPFVMNDVMGLENKDGVQTADVISALLGHVKEGYEFNPDTPLTEGDRNYVSNPSPDDKVHCLVTIVSANSLSLMDQSVIKKMKTVKQQANDIDIPQIVLLTKIDEVCPLVKKDLKKTYTSKKIHEKINQCSNLIGTPVKFIFPVKNYCYESDTNDPTDILIMLALRHIVSAANDYVASL